MLPIVAILSTLLFAVMHKSTAHPQECSLFGKVSVCLGEKSVEVDISPDDLTCQVNHVSDPKKFRDDYTHTLGIGWHKFHTEAKTWNEAMKVCMSEGAHLAIVNSKAEEELLRNIFKKELKNIKGAKTTDEAFIGIHDYFGENDWVTVNGEPLASTGFVNWSTKCYGPQPDGGIYQNCGALTHKCEGMDDTYCTMPLAFFCEKSDIC